jgi:hypothetical protein
MNMKKQILMLPLFALVVVSSLMMVSAGTLIAGKIYDSPNFETANAVANANIHVVCGEVPTETVSAAFVTPSRDTVSKTDGTYSVIFSMTECPLNSKVTVTAEKDGISNTGTGIVNDYTALMVNLYIGVVNIALVPEFGVIVGGLTILSAIGIFFFVRRQ